MISSGDEARHAELDKCGKGSTLPHSYRHRMYEVPCFIQTLHWSSRPTILQGGSRSRENVQEYESKDLQIADRTAHSARTLRQDSVYNDGMVKGVL
jgi:hypothetical protein